MGGSQNLDAAATIATALAKAAPGNARLQLLAGQALLSKGSLDEAREHLLSAAQADPRSDTAQVLLARLELARKNYRRRAATRRCERSPSAKAM